MNSGLALVGIAAVTGLLLATRKSKASPPLVISEPDMPLPEEEEPSIPEPPVDSPSGGAGGTPGAGSGTPQPSGDSRLALLPPELQEVSLSGKEEYHYVTLGPHGPEKLMFHHWTIADSLNGMNIEVFKRPDFPGDWISFFWHPDGPGSVPSGHAIIFKISPTATTRMKEWMTKNIAGIGT